MTKKELAAIVAEKAGISKKDADAAVSAVVAAVTDELAKGGNVAISGFGTFEVRARGERKGLNPRTKETVIIPATKAPAFKAGKALKDACK